MKIQLSSIAIACLTGLLTFGVTHPLSAQERIGRSDSCVPNELVLPSGEPYPNGIAWTSDGTLYVGFVTSGRILRKRPGESWKLFFGGADTVFAANSLRLDERHGLLWGTSPDFLPSGQARSHRVFALNLATGEISRSLTLPGGGMPNDIFVTPDGVVYVTDTTSGTILRLRSKDGGFEVVYRDERLASPTGIGAAGIVRTQDGTLIVNNFGTGKIYALNEGSRKTLQLRELSLPRLIENPDGMGLAPDGALIVLENAIQSGAGKILRIADPLQPGLRNIEVLREGLESPVNLTITANGCAFITESRIRHRLLPGHEADTPDRFRILEIPIGFTRFRDRNNP
ncbi:Vgb family protein [Pseudomonas sp.]|uniref:Vgb family protein n=1 Tax=Pseudomonas sp. TaxID=306 RepID=UPI003D6E9E37